MNNQLFLLSLLFFCFSCSNNQQTTSAEQVEIAPDWLQGNWQRTNDEPGRATFETWKKIGSDDYQGLGFTMVEGDTVFKEHLQVRKVNNNWVLEVAGVHEQTMPFKFTQLTANSFVAENPENEFPKRIAYTFDGKQLVAKVSADEMEIDFLFEKINQ